MMNKFIRRCDVDVVKCATQVELLDRLLAIAAVDGAEG
jgi:hypothetical protein